MVSQGEVQSPLQTGQQQSKNNNGVEPQPHQEKQQGSSIYALTLDEFQSSLMSDNGGKNVGSMNMDEFLASIWNAEDNQQQPQTQTNVVQNNVVEKQRTLVRQGSVSLPEPLGRKTVDEVWSEIRETQQSTTASTAQRRATYGEMTLEDFLVKAGVVRDQHWPHHRHSYSNPSIGCGVVPAPALGVPAYPQQQNVFGETVAGYGQMQGLCMEPPAVNGPSEVAGIGSRKRAVDGPPEVVVVERRQRRMIKNRESAARSRARKQAYTVELEAELKQMKAENIRLKQALEDTEKKRKKQKKLMEEKRKAQTEAKKSSEKSKKIRRSFSCPF